MKGKSTIQPAKWILTILLTICHCSLIAQNSPHERKNSPNGMHVVDINIFNRYDDHLLDTTYMGNNQVLQLLDSLMRDSSVISHTNKINVVSSSSIEGRISYNRRLSRRRMKTIENIFRERYNFLNSDIWEFSFTPENWDYLRHAVAEDHNTPMQEQVLSIIDMDEHTADAREHLLRTMGDGVAWEYIRQHILPLCRGSVSVLFIPKSFVPVGAYASLPEPEIEFPKTQLPLYTPTPPSYYRPLVAIRSNLLLDLSSTLNISLEVPLAPHWSLMTQYVNPWWKNWNQKLTWQIESLYFDLRYWFGSRGRHNYLSGWSVAAYAGSGRYDLQPFSQQGVQGEYSDFGVAASYSHFLGDSKHWLMEYTAGVGYVTTHYSSYYTVAATEEYGNIKVYDYPWSELTVRAVLPTRLAVTLSYLISIKKGGAK